MNNLRFWYMFGCFPKEKNQTNEGQGSLEYFHEKKKKKER